jgi:hypothetical protein
LQARANLNLKIKRRNIMNNSEINWEFFVNFLREDVLQSEIPGFEFVLKENYLKIVKKDGDKAYDVLVLYVGFNSCWFGFIG